MLDVKLPKPKPNRSGARGVLDVKFPRAKPNPSGAESVVGGALGLIGGKSEEVEYLRARSKDTPAEDAR